MFRILLFLSKSAAGSPLMMFVSVVLGAGASGDVFIGDSASSGVTSMMSQVYTHSVSSGGFSKALADFESTIKNAKFHVKSGLIRGMVLILRCWENLTDATAGTTSGESTITVASAGVNIGSSEPSIRSLVISPDSVSGVTEGYADVNIIATYNDGTSSDISNLLGCTSSNEDVATCEGKSGYKRITFVGVGTATITTSVYYGLTGTCSVTVEDSRPINYIYFNYTDDGTYWFYASYAVTSDITCTAAVTYYNERTSKTERTLVTSFISSGSAVSSIMSLIQVSSFTGQISSVSPTEDTTYRYVKHQ